MAELSQFDRLDLSIEKLLARRDSLPAAADPDLAPLLQIAAALRDLPRDELRIGDSIVMLGGGRQLPAPFMPTSLWLYVEDADAVYAAALRAGAKSISE